MIRELMHPAIHHNQSQSLAEATVAAGQQTAPHRHDRTEELYYIQAGSGLITLDEEQLRVGTGDTVAIPPGTVHSIHNTGGTDLVILCACTPPYSHDDTVLVHSEADSGHQE